MTIVGLVVPYTDERLLSGTSSVDAKASPFVVAINNAGIGGPSQPTGEYDIAAWDRVVATNLSGVFYSLRHELPAIVASGGGAVVNMASILGTNGFAGSPAYVAAKHGVVGLTKALAVDYGRRGVTVNCVCPGATLTGMTAAIPAAPPTSCISTNTGTDAGAMPANVSDRVRATSIIGLAKLVEDDHQYAAVM